MLLNITTVVEIQIETTIGIFVFLTILLLRTKNLLCACNMERNMANFYGFVNHNTEKLPRNRNYMLTRRSRSLQLGPSVEILAFFNF